MLSVYEILKKVMLNKYLENSKTRETGHFPVVYFQSYTVLYVEPVPQNLYQSLKLMIWIYITRFIEKCWVACNPKSKIDLKIEILCASDWNQL